MTKWITVEDRLLELIAQVIWYNEHGDVIIGKYTELGWKFSYYSGVPTHGKPIPESPDEKEEEDEQ